RRAALGRDHRVPRMLLHEDAVAEPERERAPAAALADDRAHDRHRQRRERAQARADRLGLPALLRRDARVRALGVDERDDGASEPLRKLEQADGLPVAFGTRHAEVPRDPLALRPAALLADDDDRVAAKAGE